MTGARDVEISLGPSLPFTVHFCTDFICQNKSLQVTPNPQIDIQALIPSFVHIELKLKEGSKERTENKIKEERERINESEKGQAEKQDKARKKVKSTSKEESAGKKRRK